MNVQSEPGQRNAESVDLFGNLGGTLHEALRKPAANSPIAWDCSTGAAVVFRHRDVEALAHDPRVAGIGLSLFDLMGIEPGPLRDWYGGIMFTNEGAAHQRLRSLVARAFTPRSAEALRSAAAALASQALGPASRAEASVDLVELFAGLPTRLMCQLLGVPEPDVPRFAAWLEDLSPIFFLMTPAQIRAASRAIPELLGYVNELAERRRAYPRHDLISALLAARDGDERLAHEEVVGLVANLLVAGHDTTTSQLGCSLLALLTQPCEASRISAEAHLLTGAVSETVRLEPAIPMIPRTARESLRIDGHQVPAGSTLMLCTATANRDPLVWHEPERFDAARFTHPGTPRVLTFGAGAHYCLGTALARITIEECLRAVLTLEPRYVLVEPPSEIPWRVVLGRSPQRLLVTTNVNANSSNPT